MSSYIYYMILKFIMKNVLFHCMCLKYILSDVKSNIMKQLVFYIQIEIFSFSKKDHNLRKTFFLVEGKFSILTLKIWNLFEKLRSISKILPPNFKTFREHLKVIEKQKYARGEKMPFFPLDPIKLNIEQDLFRLVMKRCVLCNTWQL